MAKRKWLANDVFGMAYDRIAREMAAGHRVVVTQSGGKDSTVCMELALMAARDLDYGPVDVVTRDEEIMLPGTFEYLERVAERPEVNFHWYLQDMPVTNLFDRECPYWWTFDDRLAPEDWVRIPPPFAHPIPTGVRDIRGIVDAKLFPPDEGKTTFSVTGIRTDESPLRTMAIASSARSARLRGEENAGHLTKVNPWGVRGLRPIYDWETPDVWKFIRDFKLDYNHAYDTQLRMGVPISQMRIAPPTQRISAIRMLRQVHGAWPRWFDRVCKRLPGTRTAVQYGERVLKPERRLGETWKQTFARTCLDAPNPEWIRRRSEQMLETITSFHRQHATGELPDSTDCPLCATENPRSYRQLALLMYGGDPMSSRNTVLPVVQPEEFREGAGTWGGTDGIKPMASA